VLQFTLLISRRDHLCTFAQKLAFSRLFGAKALTFALNRNKNRRSVCENITFYVDAQEKCAEECVEMQSAA